MGLVPGSYLISIARLEPDNNILTMITAFSRRRRGTKLVVLGTLDANNPYHAGSRPRQATSDVSRRDLRQDVVRALALPCPRLLPRTHGRRHQPSLVESLWCGNAVLAHRQPLQSVDADWSNSSSPTR